MAAAMATPLPKSAARPGLQVRTKSARNAGHPGLHFQCTTAPLVPEYCCKRQRTSRHGSWRPPGDKAWASRPRGVLPNRYGRAGAKPAGKTSTGMESRSKKKQILGNYAQQSLCLHHSRVVLGCVLWNGANEHASVCPEMMSICSLPNECPRAHRNDTNARHRLWVLVETENFFEGPRQTSLLRLEVAAEPARPVKTNLLPLSAWLTQHLGRKRGLTPVHFRFPVACTRAASQVGLGCHRTSMCASF
jgi:hypothetical protein